MADDDGDAADRPAPAPSEPEPAGDNAAAAAGADRPRPTPGGRHAAPDPDDEPDEPDASAVEPGPEEPGPEEPAPSVGSSRRGILLGAAAVVVAAGGGVGAGFLAKRRRAPVHPLPPAALTAAVDAERALIADLDATTGGTAEVRVVIVQARADHAAHLQALEALLGGYRRPLTSAPAPRGVARSAAALREAETNAAVDSGRRAAASAGSLAALFASISACESTHAALLA